MEANNLKISADLQAYIKSVVDTEIAINNNSNAIPTYSLYSYNAMSTASVDTGAIIIDGQDIVEYCETMREDVDSNKSLVNNHDTEIQNLKTSNDSKISQTDLTNKLNDYVQTSTFNTFDTDNTTAINKKLDKSEFTTYQGTMTTKLSDKLDTATFNSFKGDNTTALGNKLDKSTFTEFDKNNTSALSNKLETSTFNTFKGENTTAINKKLDETKFTTFTSTTLPTTLKGYISTDDFNEYKKEMTSIIDSLKGRLTALENS